MFRDTWPREQISGYLANFMVIRNLVNKNMMFQFWENKLFLSKIDIINISHTVSKWVDIRNSNFFYDLEDICPTGETSKFTHHIRSQLSYHSTDSTK